jgi:hypothetical protein
VTETSSPSAARPVQTAQFLRAICHVLALVVITWWALAEWPLPWPGLLAGIGFFALVVLLWALFLSPRPVLRTDRFGQALVELLLIAGAVGALLGLGVHWALALLFGVVAAVLGYLAGAKR